MKIKTIFYSIASTVLFWAPAVSAQGIQSADGPLDKVIKKTGIVEGDISTVIGTTISVVLSMVGLLFLAFMVYAGMLWMTARGNEDQVGKAQKIIIASVIGLFIVVSAYAITVFVTSRFQ